jgi:AAA+ ATPase superfamily predicted ATPase
MTTFIGRTAELAALDKRLLRVRADGAGLAVAIRGRRQVGKSRLAQEFCDRSGAPYFFFSATKGMPAVESVARFCAELRESALPAESAVLPDLTNGSWTDALRVLASALPDRPCVVVLDELPWLAEQDAVFDGALQTAWDRLLSRKPVFLLLLGSDLHMMERLTAYDRPFYGRATPMSLGPLNPAETGDALGLGAVDSVDAHLVSGGLPGIFRAWPRGMPALDFLRQECADPASPVFTVPEAALMAEFSQPDHSRRVLEAIGSGERTQANIAATAGSRAGVLPSGALTPILRRLTEEKAVVTQESPLSVDSGKPSLYRVADSSLRLYLAILRDSVEEVRRGRAEAAYGLVQRRWTAWRGRAVEPLVRDALARAAADGRLPWKEVGEVGGWWNRRFDPEIDLVGADRGRIARRVYFAGSVKWLGSQFDSHDLAVLREGAAAIPGWSDEVAPGLLGVSLSGFKDEVAGLDVRWGPEDVLDAWR